MFSSLLLPLFRFEAEERGGLEKGKEREIEKERERSLFDENSLVQLYRKYRWQSRVGANTIIRKYREN